MVDREISEEAMGTMKDTPEGSELRQRAEKELAIESGSTGPLSEMSPEKMANLIHELEVHQIELVIQNDELRSTQDKLEKARDRYSHLYDFAPIGYFSINQKGVIDEANLTFASMVGVARGDLIEQPFSLFVLKDDQDIYYKHRQRLLEAEAPQPFELGLVRNDGCVFYARLESTIITSKEDDLKQIRVAVSDVTERKRAEDALHKAHFELERMVEERTVELAKTNHKLNKEVIERKKAEEALRESEERLNLVIKGSNDAPWDWDLISNELYYSPRWWLQLGYTPNELPVDAALWERLMHPEDSDHVDSVFRGALKNGIESYEVEFRLLHKDGHYVPVLSRGFITRDENGKPIRVTGTNMDLSEHKQAQEALRESEQLYRDIFEKNKAMKWILDPTTGKIIDVNSAACEFYQYSYEEMTKLYLWDINLLGEAEIKKFIASGEPDEQTDYTFRHRLASGEIRTVQVYTGTVVSGGKKLLHSILIDITERKRAEEALKKIEWLLEKENADLQKTAKNFIPDYGDVTKLNTERTILDNVGAETLKTLCSDIMDLLDTSIAIYEKNGDYAFGQFDSTWCQTMDLASFRLCKTQDNKEALNCGKWLCHENCWNDSAKEAIKLKETTDIECIGGIHLYAVPIYAGKNLIGVINMGYGNPPTDERTLKELAKKYHVEYESLIENSTKYKARPPFIIENAKKRLHTVAQLIGKIVDSAQKEKQIKKAKEKAEKSENKLQTVIDQSPFPIALVDESDERILYWSQSGLNTFGHNPSNVSEWYELAYPDPAYREQVINRWKPFLEKAYKTKKVINTGEYRIACKDGTTKICEIFAQFIPGNLVVTMNDITERKKAEEALLQLHKMEAIGTLAGGIAHDYNNLMSIIMGNLSMAQEEAKPGSALADFLNEANMASLKVRDLTHELMSLSRGGMPVREVGYIDEVLKNVSELIPADSGISLSESISKDLKLVSYDRHKMGAVIRNVVKNAVEAMPDGGTLKIKAENLRVEDAKQDLGLILKPGDFVHISIQDQGKGIPEEHMDKIFDPYFSTKAMGVQKGMGLGLATAYAIIKQHGGHIQIDSSLGAGTTVNIYLPAESQPAEAYSTSPKKDDSAFPMKRLLVMDDEEMLRNLARQMLERMGYAVETVEDGLEAIEKYKKQKDSSEPFDAVVLDLTIKGGMGGEQTIRELLKIDPDVKAIVSSGYFDDPVMSDFEKYGFMGALPKPYNKEALKEVLERISE